MADIGGIQLLPQSRKELKGVKKKGENKFFYIGIAIPAVVVILGFGLTLYKMTLESKIDDLNQQFTALEGKRDKKGEANLKILSVQISTISDLIKNHIFLTKAFDKVGSIIDEKVQVSGFSINNTTGKIALKAVALNYATVARQLAAFLSDDVIKEVLIGNLAVNTNGNVEFSINITFDQVKLLNKQ